MSSKATAWGGLLLTLVIILLTFSLRTVWWCFFDIFFLFMMTFLHLVAVYVGRLNRHSAIALDRIAFWCGILFVVSLIAEFIVWQVIS